MSLTAGHRLGPYEIIGPLGSGGMGEVYRARDLRLNREVAIKVLAQAGADPSRQRRFTDEAQAASALNHPNILTVYDVGSDDDGIPYIVSELVEGESLRARLTHAPLAVRDMLDLGVQMADGLAAAHQAGIVHRDFKPENVMVTRDGRVKILDFGLALVGLRDGVSASDVDVTLTATGVIVGTVPYMSPEQARGAPVDYRTDQFSLGLTLYELVTGRRTFQAATAAQTLAAIIEDEPEPIARVNPKVPAPVRWAIERCLAKDPRQRYDATADLARELRTLRDRVAEFAPSTEIARAAPRHRQLGAFAIAGAVVAAAASLAWNIVANPNPGPDLSAYRLMPIATDPGYQGSPAWSPDGKTLAYVADVDGVLQVFTRALTSPMRQQVTRGSFDAQEPFWSPDGTRLYYLSRARDRYGLWSTSVSGGQPEIVVENVTRATLSPDGQTLAFFRSPENVAGTTLWLSSPPGAPPVQYTRPPLPSRIGDEATLHFSPDSSKLGVWLQRSAAETGTAHPEFWVLPMQKGVPHVAPSSLNFPENTSPDFSWLPDSRRIVSALPFPKPGVHLWLSDTERSASRLLTITGNVEGSPAISPDGTRLALTFQQADYDVYQLAIDHPSPSMLLATSRNEMDPVASPTGDQVAFTSDRAGHDEIWLHSQRGDLERPLVTQSEFGTSQTFTLGPTAFSPDGQHIAYNRFSAEGSRIWISAIAGGPPVQLAAGTYWQDAPSWSPDGAWIAYVQSTGVHYVGGEWLLVKMRVGTRTSPTVLASDLVPDYYAHDVKWAPDDSWIAYNSRGGLSIVSPDGKSARALHEQTWLAFAWSADSRRLYGIRPSEDGKYLMFTSVDIRSGVERVLNARFMPLPLSRQPVRGFARASATTFITSIPHVRSDIWLLEGFDPQSSLRDRLSAFFFSRRQ